MSALREAQRTATAAGGAMDWKFLGVFFWRWYHEHRRDVIIKRKVIIFSVTIRVEDLRPLFVSLFGEQPTDAIIE